MAAILSRPLHDKPSWLQESIQQDNTNITGKLVFALPDQEYKIY